MLDLLRLKYFRVVAETASLRKAAVLLSVAPSTLSKAIKSLENDFGTTLIQAEGRGIAITPSGRLVSERARRLLADAEELLSVIKTAPPSPLRIGSHSTFTTYFLARFLADEMAEGEKVHIRQAMPGEMERLLTERAIDYALTYAPTPTPDVEYHRAAVSELALYAQVGRLRAFAAMDLAALPTVAPITSVADSAMRSNSFDGWPRDFYDRSINYEIEGLDAALAVCRRGLAVGYFPSFLIKLHNADVRPELRLERVPVPPHLRGQKLTLYIVRRRGEAEDSLMKKLSKSLRLACRAAKEGAG